MSVCRWARASGAACRGGVLDWRVWWGWRRLRQGAAGARAQALGLCLQVTVRAGFLASSGQSLGPADTLCGPHLPPMLTRLLPRGSRLAPQPSPHVPTPHSLTPSLGPGPLPPPASPCVSPLQHSPV